MIKKFVRLGGSFAPRTALFDDELKTSCERFSKSDCFISRFICAVNLFSVVDYIRTEGVVSIGPTLSQLIIITQSSRPPTLPQTIETTNFADGVPWTSYSSNVSYNIEETVPAYFNGIVLQRKYVEKLEMDDNSLKLPVVANLTIIWTIVFICLSKGRYYA